MRGSHWQQFLNTNNNINIFLWHFLQCPSVFFPVFCPMSVIHWSVIRNKSHYETEVLLQHLPASYSLCQNMVLFDNQTLPKSVNFVQVHFPLQLVQLSCMFRAVKATSVGTFSPPRARRCKFDTLSSLLLPHNSLCLSIALG